MINAKQNILGTFSHTLLTDQDEVSNGVKVIQTEHPDTSEMYCKNGNSCCFTDCVKKISVGLHSDVTNRFDSYFL